MTPPALKADILSPAELGAAEFAVWHGFQDASPALRRAFLSPEFALASEQAFGRVRVAVVHRGGEIAGFFPFQFETAVAQRLRSAVRVGGEMSDSAGLIGSPDLRLTARDLLALTGLSSLYITHLNAGQQRFGLEAEVWEVGHLIDLFEGVAPYFAELQASKGRFVQDTLRRLRKAEAEFGPLTQETPACLDPALAMQILQEKRRQYRRTGKADPFTQAKNLRLIEALCAVRSSYCALRADRLSAGGTVLASHLGLRCGDTLSYWFPSYAPAARHLAPGRLLLWRLLEDAEASRLRLIDRGLGDSAAKRDFSNVTQRLGKAFWSAASWRAATARGLWSLRWRVASSARRHGPS